MRLKLTQLPKNQRMFLFSASTSILLSQGFAGLCIYGLTPAFFVVVGVVGTRRFGFGVSGGMDTDKCLVFVLRRQDHHVVEH